jgi:hypothetical protein
MEFVVGSCTGGSGAGVACVGGGLAGGWVVEVVRDDVTPGIKLSRAALASKSVLSAAGGWSWVDKGRIGEVLGTVLVTNDRKELDIGALFFEQTTLLR